MPQDRRSDEPRTDSSRAVARVLDDLIRIPGTNFRIGLDPLMGLIPGLGDLLGGALSGYIVYLAAREGAPGSVLFRMLANIGIDSLIGAVPILGDLFDFGWKANSMNATLLDEYRLAPRAVRRSSMVFVGGILLLMLLIVVGGVAL